MRLSPFIAGNGLRSTTNRIYSLVCRKCVILCILCKHENKFYSIVIFGFSSRIQTDQSSSQTCNCSYFTPIVCVRERACISQSHLVCFITLNIFRRKQISETAVKKKKMLAEVRARNAYRLRHLYIAWHNDTVRWIGQNWTILVWCAFRTTAQKIHHMIVFHWVDWICWRLISSRWPSIRGRGGAGSQIPDFTGV